MKRTPSLMRKSVDFSPVFSGEQVKRLVRFDPDELRYTITDQGRALLVEIASHEPSNLFTPNEALASNPLMVRVMTTRLETLLTQHEPVIFPKWLQSMEAEGLGRELNPEWYQSLSFVAAAIPLQKRRNWVSNKSNRLPCQNRRMERNRRLITRLVFKGCLKRGDIQ